ncbi:DUF3387 domain-containing protein [Sinorhizobium meliloti]
MPQAHAPGPVLARYGYPPDLQKAAVDLVLEQANVIASDWAV